jgi:hypothetical protein
VNPLDLDEPKVRLMYQRRRLDGVAGMLADQTSLRDFAQLGINPLDDSAVRVLVAGSPGMKKCGYFR